MNQILNTKLKNNTNNKITKDKFYKIIFCDSLIIIFVFSCFLIYKLFTIKKYENISNNLSGNYDIYKLYSNSRNKDNEIKNDLENEIFGTIEIQKIDIKYPIFSKIDDNLLKISPCKFYGSSPKEFGNLCIAGHNYDNSNFFSNLFLLDINDEIFIYDNLNNKYVYKVFKIYEVNNSDLSPIFDYNVFSKELTLVTCNNINKNRLIIKARQ